MFVNGIKSFIPTKLCQNTELNAEVMNHNFQPLMSKGTLDNKSITNQFINLNIVPFRNFKIAVTMLLFLLPKQHSTCCL